MAESRILRPGEQILRVTPNGPPRLNLGRGVPTLSGVLPSSTKLKFGPYAGMSGLTGIGPGGDLGAPIYGISGTNPHSEGATVRSQSIDIAEANDITIFATTCDSPASFGAFPQGTGFDMTKYTAKIQTIANDAKYKAAIQRGRVICLAADECQHSKWSPGGNGSLPSTWTPTKLNDCGRLHKQLMPGAIVVARMEPELMRNGWDGFAPHPSWDGIDYCVMQYEGPNAQRTETWAKAMSDARIDAAACGLGVIPSLNWWGGGNHRLCDGINHCWDYLNNGSSSGVVAGGVQVELSQGQQMTCAEWNAWTPKRTLTMNPAWMHRIFDLASVDPAIPWLCAWAHPLSNLGLTWAQTYYNRADWRGELDTGITKCLARPTANPIPAAKPYILP